MNNNKNYTCTFVGHRQIINIYKLKIELMQVLENLILNGCDWFLIGRHVDFDNLALRCCLELGQKYGHIKISLVMSSLNYLNKNNNDYKIDAYLDVEVFSYPIENYHFKQRIIKTNEKKIDAANIVVAYVDMNEIKSGAKKSLKYAKNKGKKIINLYNS